MTKILSVIVKAALPIKFELDRIFYKYSKFQVNKIYYCNDGSKFSPNSTNNMIPLYLTQVILFNVELLYKYFFRRIFIMVIVLVSWKN